MAGIDLSRIIGVGDKQIVSGITSGFDSAELINSLVEAKRAPAVELEEELELNAGKVTAYSELRTIMEALKTATSYLRNPAGISNASQNIFEYRTANLSINSSSTIANLLSVSAAAGADLGEYTVAIGNLAEAKTLRTNTFTSKTSSVTEAAGGNTVGMFSAGVFAFGAPVATEVDVTTASGFTLTASDYYTAGTVGGTVITSAGTHTFADDNASADTKLEGTLTSFSHAYDAGSDTMVITISKNGRSYVSNIISTAGGGGGNSIAAGTEITFTNSTTGTSFKITTGASDYVIADTPANAAQFVTDVQSALSTQTILQSRKLGNFDDTEVTAPIDGLTANHVRLRSDDYNTTDGTHGEMDGFTITHVGVNNNTISVVINGETYQATGLADSYNSNLVLTSTTSNNNLRINFNDAGVTVDMSSQNAADALEAALDYAFGTRALTQVTLSEGDSLVDIAAAINAVSSDSNVAASILQVSDTDFRLTLQSTVEGTDNAFVIVDDEDVTGDVTFNTIQAAEDATFKVDGVELTRSTNTIDDVIGGLTFTLRSVTANYGLGGEEVITVDIVHDTETVAAGIENFINAYNDFRVFADTHLLREDDGTFREESILGGDTTLSTLVTQLYTEINRVVAGAGNADLDSLLSLGISVTDFAGNDETPETKNILTFDSTVLADYLANNFDDVREIFEMQFVPSSSVLSLYKSSNALDLTSFKVDVDTSRAAGNEVRILDSSNTFLFNMDFENQGNGIYKFTGQEGTDLEGIEFLYTGDGTDVVTVSATQGIGDRFFNVLEGYLEDDGTLDSAIDDLSDEEERLQEEIDRIDEQIERYREQQIAIFSALEEAIARVNLLLNFLDVQAQSIFGSNN